MATEKIIVDGRNDNELVALGCTAPNSTSTSILEGLYVPNDGRDIYLGLKNGVSSGTDYEINNAINQLNWNDCNITDITNGNNAIIDVQDNGDFISIGTEIQAGSHKGLSVSPQNQDNDIFDIYMDSSDFDADLQTLLTNMG